MSNNYRHYDKAAAPLNTADLAVGQVLTLVNIAGTWGGRRRMTEREVTVVKVLKTRLVVRRSDGVQLRFIVEYSDRWPSRNGEVSSDLEGARGDVWSGHMRREYLFTEGDAALTELREAVRVETEAEDAKKAAQVALDAFKRSLSVEDAQSAIEALQAFVATRGGAA